VPDKKKLDEMKASRLKIVHVQADRDAASMILRVVPAEGATPAELALDGGALPAVAKLATASSLCGATEGGIAHPGMGASGIESRDKQRRPRSD